jgi:hypothetical protein
MKTFTDFSDFTESVVFSRWVSENRCKLFNSKLSSLAAFGKQFILPKAEIFFDSTNSFQNNFQKSYHFQGSCFKRYVSMA